MDIIGMGRVGDGLARRAEARGVPVHRVDRTTGWEALADHTGPLLVATRNDDLDAVLAKVPAHRRDDLVFVQNGMLRSWLAANDLAEASRGLLFFAVPTRGAELEPGPPSPFVGRHAAAVVAWLDALEVPAAEVSDEVFAASEIEKLLWNTIFGLLCDVHDLSVGPLVHQHRDQVAGLVAELLPVAEEAIGLSLDAAALTESLCAYSLQIPAYQGAVKAWPWRAGWFVDTAAAQGRALPLHEALMAARG